MRTGGQEADAFGGQRGRAWRDVPDGLEGRARGGSRSGEDVLEEAWRGIPDGGEVDEPRSQQPRWHTSAFSVYSRAQGDARPLSAALYGADRATMGGGDRPAICTATGPYHLHDRALSSGGGGACYSLYRDHGGGGDEEQGVRWRADGGRALPPLSTVLLPATMFFSPATVVLPTDLLPPMVLPPPMIWLPPMILPPPPWAPWLL